MIGKHLLADLYGVSPERLDDAELLARCLEGAARECRLTPVAPPVLHCFPGGGVTGFLLLAESHIAFHSYPEHGYLALDIFSCGAADPEAALAVCQAMLQPGDVRVTVEPRGEGVERPRVGAQAVQRRAGNDPPVQGKGP
jgi:S-adenosylmethionine decarboxylase